MCAESFSTIFGIVCDARASARPCKNGTPERPYPLIIDDSITDSTDGMIDYTYACGIGSGVMLVPFTEYYNQLSTDV